MRRSLGVSSLSNTFASFKAVSGAEKALNLSREIASDKTPWQMLLIYGGVGNGKTHLLEAIAIALHEERKFARVMNFSAMIRAFKNAFKPEAGKLPYDELILSYCKATRLILDDVGIGGSESEWSMGQLEEIIMHRYRENLFTVLSTNLDLNQLPERVVSRFSDPMVGRLVLNSAPDYRAKRSKNVIG